MLKIGLCAQGGRGVPNVDGLQVFEVRASNRNLPSAKVCRSWKESAPGDLIFLVNIPMEAFFPSGRKTAGGFLDSPAEVRKSWNKVIEIAGELDADILTMSLPSMVTPTAANRKKILWFLEEVVGERFKIVWEPCGLWSPEDVKNIAGDSNLVVGLNDIVDETDVLESNWVFLRYKGLGRASLSGDALYNLADFCRGPWSGVCLLDMPHATKCFKNLFSAIKEIE